MFSSVSVSSDAQDTQLSMFAALATSMPQDTVDLILADGSNQRNSTLRIAARFRKDFSMEENAAFLQREYGRGGKGFTVGRQKVSAYWDVNGIRMDYGESAQTDTALTITWQDAAARIRELLDVGRYITQTEMDFTDYNERSELADQLWYVYRDDGLRMPEEWNSKKGFSDDVKLIRAESESPQQRDRIIARYLADIENIDTINSTRRRYHNLQRLAENLLAYQRPQLDFAAPQTLPKPAERFITQDEIDIELSRGTPYENGRRDVFNYFRQPHTLKERIDFLKRSYGIGGHSAALGGADDAWEDHDSKGILLRRGNLTKPYTRTLLSWQNAAQRIAELIDANRYLKADELAENQKREQEAALELPIATPESSVTTSESSDTVDDIAAPPKECELGFGKLGNGTTVWNRLEERDGDYRTVAHISDDGIASVGKDENGSARYAMLRATGESTFRMEAEGSDKRYSFQLCGDDGGMLFVTESAIDALSVATLMLQAGKNWKRHHYLSLGGVSVRKNEEKLPMALAKYLAVHPEIRKVRLMLDNDAAGHRAADSILPLLGDSYDAAASFPKIGKDYNDELQTKRQNEAER